MKYKLFLLLCLSNLILGTHAVSAQVLTGHYVPGFVGGLNSGILPTRPGFILSNGTFFYHANKFVDNTGTEVPGNNELNIIANRLGVLWISPFKVIGAQYAPALALPLANFAPNPIILEDQRVEGRIGIGDIALQPFAFGWHWGKFHLLFGDTLFFPTGRFKVGALDNTGKGFYTNMFNLGWAYRWGDKLPFTWSMILRYEIHTRQRETDLVPGQTLTIEYGLGKQLHQRLTLGAVGFYWQQVTDISGPNAENVGKYRTLGLGLETQVQVTKRSLVKLKALFDFAPRNASEGIGGVMEWNFLL